MRGEQSGDLVREEEACAGRWRVSCRAPAGWRDRRRAARRDVPQRRPGAQEHASANSMAMVVVAMLLLALAGRADSFSHGSVAAWDPRRPLWALDVGEACARPLRDVKGARKRAGEPAWARRLAAARMSEDVYRDLGQDILSRSHTGGPNKMWLLLPEVFVLLSTPTPAAATERSIYTVQTQEGHVDHGYGYTSPTYKDSVVIFEQRGDAQSYASLLAAQGVAQFQVSSVDPRRVTVSAVTTGCKLSFHAAGALVRPPSVSAGGDKSKQVSAGSHSARPWLPYGRGAVAEGDVEAHRSYKLTRKDSLLMHDKLPTAAEAREQAQRKKDADDDLREEGAWRATELIGNVRGRQRATLEHDKKRQNILKGRDVVARQRPAGKEWLSLPEVYVLTTSHVPSAAPSELTPTVYTLKEKKGFYDLGQGYKSPAFKHHLPVFADKADAKRSALLLEASGFERISVQRVEARQTFVFSAKAGMHVSFVPPDTLFLPPEEEAGNDDVISSFEQKWRPQGGDIFDMKLLEDNFGIDYQDARQRLEELFRNPDM